MKKVYLTALLSVGLSISAFAVQRVPLDSKGNSLDYRYAGVSTCVIGNSTGTNAVLCATGAGIILDVFPSTTSTESIVFRDSATANTSSTILGAVAQASVSGSHIYPRFKNGLSVNSASTIAGGTYWTVIYSQDIK